MIYQWRYWLDFWLFPPIVTVLIIVNMRSLGWVANFIGGACLWTFVEYWTHRSVLHRWFWHGTHENHHLKPEDFVENIWWYTPLLFGILWIILPLSWWVGFAAGYIWFMLMHHWLHHRPLHPEMWLYNYAKWHGLHHKFGNCNYGITTNVWDRLFRTSLVKF